MSVTSTYNVPEEEMAIPFALPGVWKTHFGVNVVAFMKYTAGVVCGQKLVM